MDVFYVGLTVVLFLLTLGLIEVCGRLLGD
jgi:hypothetical protein